MTIILTGTHLTPAIATIQALRRKVPQARLVYVGRKHTGTAESVEKEEIVRAGAEFRPIIFGKLHRHFTWRQILELVKFPAGFWQAGKLVNEFKPDVVMSFGGYVALPVAIWGKLKGAKLVVHEQTARWGLANRLTRKLADKVAVSWEEMAGPGVVWTGNPIRDEIISIQESPGVARRLLNKFPVLYITGGNQGSRVIDKAVEPILPDLVEKFEVFHQTKSNFNFKHPRYHSYQWFSTPIHAEILSRTAVSVSRAGANTAAELAYLEIPAIVVPLPDSAGGEQQENARILEKTGLGKVINQEDLSPERLMEAIGEWPRTNLTLRRVLRARPQRAVVRGSGGSVRKGKTAAEKLAEVILALKGATL
jgi:UDP-N-acetylglucosamine--N-acetylmuramyl-(pentapeptide) pyrophosphoryl-undecaprenol N-acetylglucosamine transferase